MSSGGRVSKRKQQAPPGRGTSTAEDAPDRVDGGGVGEHEETASDLKVPLIVFPREKGPKVALRIAEEISQHITIL